MSLNESLAQPRLDEITLIVCDAGGRIQAVTSGASSDYLDCSSTSQKHFAEVFGRDSVITHWLSEHLSEARKRRDYYAETSLENGSNSLMIKLESLKCDEELYGFAIQMMPGASSIKTCKLDEGDAVIYRKQWHEIKNHIGALKLYATFLTRKMQEGDERQTVEKMLNGINVLIEYLAKIRRGDLQ